MQVAECDEGSGVEDSLGVLLEQASSGLVAAALFLEALANQSTLVILRQPTGEGADSNPAGHRFRSGLNTALALTRSR